ncbi:MAG: prolipoprotein diacylglyceryl transferase, partial [Thermodesulfobacteriota bacterium]|nr:prolipoprotein diacylglyceryl transferase [Thermodesulfobacteriota bacterium]
LDHPLDILKIWQGGLVFSGGLIAVALAMGWYFMRHDLPFWKMADLWAPAVAIGQGIGRIGCFMAGCCFGKPTDMKWGVVFTHPHSLAPLSVPLHPTQLYASFSGLIIFLVLLILQARKKFQGQVFLWFLILHSTGRLLVERFRGDYRGLVPGTEMSITQLVSLLILTGSVIMLFIMKSRNEKKGDSVLNN